MGWFWSERQLPSKTEELSEEGNVASPGYSVTHRDDSSSSIFGTGISSLMSPSLGGSDDGRESGSDQNPVGALFEAGGESGGGGRLNTVAWCAVTAATVWYGNKSYKTFIRRIKNVGYLKPHQLRKKSLFGYVTRVGDGDNFRLYHTPLGRFAGWGLWRKVPTKVSDLKDQTLSVRIAGIDAPELPHFGKPGQPHGQDALDWLTNYIQHRRVRVLPLSTDQYGRVVGTVHVRGLFSRDVGLEMIKAGWATVYEAKSGAEFAGKEEQYREAEARAKQKKVGMWGGQTMIGKLLGKKQEPLESPRDFKTRAKKEESAPK
ncbi:Putative staphylococcal nuclease (SNase-like), SNase-like, superfamily [Septoria linicola]|uniref:Probable endonuclease LCL3 n=1 Tax=Septoria linicola TaxID=215465 RepID=A0A9Q9AWZ9_9PEZI|nr:putative staphylococcal nuclease (SNase-like), SNase-like, superfamily [Septoria linicola]USW54040.1 Putative staphylococcal nuclease (SNase-like), SNase-like, superfamily [Septoria linicola]